MKHVITWYAVLMSMAISAVFFCASCKEDHDGPLPPAPQPSDRIEVTYPSSPSVEGGCTGTGTAEDPLVVVDDALTATIAVTGKYHDPDGSTVSCTSQATTRVSLSAGTPVVSINDLLSVVEHAGAPSVSSDGSKKTTRCPWTFTVGGKDIIFDQSYEEFTYTNSQGKVIPWPYLKFTTVKCGSVNADEATTSRGIRLRRLAPTRADVITDSVTYEVTVPFTVYYESQNTDDAKTDSLVIDVVFNAVVVTATEIPDPTTQLSYELSHKSGTTSSASPFGVIPGDTLFLEWSGVSSYQYFSISNRTGMEIKYKPWAFAKVYAEKADTMWIKDVADLKAILLDPIVATSGTNPVENTGLYAWNIAGHKVTVNYGYQLYQPIMVEGTEVVLPSLAIGSPEIRLEFTEKTTTKTAKVYDVTLTIDQELAAVNTSEPQSERVQYVVKYIAAIPIEAAKIVDIRYRKPSPAGPGWNEAHDNISLVYQYKLLVDTVFSDGSVHTAEIYGMPHPIFWALNDLPSRAGYYGQTKMELNGEMMYFFANQDELVDETYHNVTISRVIAVPDTAKITLKDDGEGGPDPADWTRYSGYDPEHPQPGWYMTNLAPYHNARIYYDGRRLMFFDINFIWYNDIYYANDVINGGRLISFLGDENDVDDVSYEPNINFDITTGTTVLPDGQQAKSFVHTCTGWMLGWNQPFVFKIKLYFITYDEQNPPF